MPAELVAHCGEQLVGEIRVAARAEAFRGGDERTCAGTPSSMAALMVDRPSPESDTRPAKPDSTGSLISAAAERS